jgi:hypothetical protein
VNFDLKGLEIPVSCAIKGIGSRKAREKAGFSVFLSTS